MKFCVSILIFFFCAIFLSHGVNQPAVAEVHSDATFEPVLTSSNTTVLPGSTSPQGVCIARIKGPLGELFKFINLKENKVVGDILNEDEAREQKGKVSAVWNSTGTHVAVLFDSWGFCPVYIYNKTTGGLMRHIESPVPPSPDFKNQRYPARDAVALDYKNNHTWITSDTFCAFFQILEKPDSTYVFGVPGHLQISMLSLNLTLQGSDLVETDGAWLIHITEQDLADHELVKMK